MRNSIISFIVLFIFLNAAAFQPPEQQKSQLITFKDLQQEKDNNKKSYLSLLPSELLLATYNYVPNNLEEMVHAIRSKYLNDPEKREKFLNDEELNAQLINELMLRFRTDNTEHSTQFLNTKVALQLNTLPSFTWLKKSIPEDKILGTTMMLGVLEAYLTKLKLNYQQSLQYVKQYLENSERSKVYYSLFGLTLHVVQYLVKHFAEPHEHVLIPEIEALADIATDGAKEWIKLILKNYSEYPPENERLLRVLLESQKNQFDQGRYEPVRNDVCLSLASLLTLALHNGDHERIKFIKNLFESVKVPHPSYKTCINKRFKWLLNAQSPEAVAQLVNAITHKQIDVIRTLLEGPYVNVNACDRYGHNALWYVRNLETDAATRLAIIELLQAAGATEEGACAIQ